MTDHAHTLTLTESDLSNVVSALVVVAYKIGVADYIDTANRVSKQVAASILRQVVAEERARHRPRDCRQEGKPHQHCMECGPAYLWPCPTIVGLNVYGPPD